MERLLRFRDYLPLIFHTKLLMRFNFLDKNKLSMLMNPQLKMFIIFFRIAIEKNFVTFILKENLE